MQLFFVGLAMRSHHHDYDHVHAILRHLRARRVSMRIWLCAVEEAVSGDIFAAIGRSLAAPDEMLIVEVPDTMRGPRNVSLAA